MKKKILNVLVIPLLFWINLYANEQSNYSVAVELARAEKVDALVSKTNSLKEYLQLYSFNTGDSSPTISEMNNYAGLGLGVSAWSNYDGNQMTLTLNGTNSLTFGGLFTNTPSAEVLNFVSNSSNLDPLANFDTLTYDLTLPFSAKLSSFLKATIDLESNPNVEISTTEPTNIAKTWYKPNGNGGYDIYGYNGAENEWQLYGSVGFGAEGGTGITSDIVVKSVSELDSIPAATGNKAYVSDGTKATEYIYDGDKWVKSAAESSGGLFNGDGTILEMATTLLSYSGGSIATTSDAYSSGLKNVYNGAKDFTKKDNTSGNGYWIDSTNTFIVGATLADISTNNWANGTHAYLPKDDLSSVNVLKKTSGRWWFIADGLNDVVLNYNEAKTTGVWDRKNNEYFRFSASTNFWYSTNSSGSNNNVSRLTSSMNGRSAFTSLNSSTVYYLLNSDCTSTTCNGSSGNGYFGGKTKDSMKIFYYATSGKRKNNLIDATPRTSIPDIYNNGDEVSLYNNNIYIKRKDTRSRTVYYNATNGYYYTKNSVIIPTVLAPRYGTSVNLPPNYDASTVSFSGSYIIMSSRTYATNWNDAPNGAAARIGSTNYVHRFGSGLDFWTNNSSGDGQQSASEIFTRGSRSNLPNITHSLNALTKSIGSESRYTSSGVVSTIDGSFYQWFYSNSGIRTRNLLDAILVTNNPYTNSLALSIGIAMKNNKLITKSGSYWKYGSSFVDKDIIVRDYSYIRAIGSSYSGTYTVPCNSSSSCYSANSPYVLHNTKGFLVKNLNTLKSTDGKYLAKNVNNHFVLNTNIALNATAYDNLCNHYYSGFSDWYQSSKYNVDFTSNNQKRWIWGGSVVATNIPRSQMFISSSTYCYLARPHNSGHDDIRKLYIIY